MLFKDQIQSGTYGRPSRDVIELISDSGDDQVEITKEHLDVSEDE